MRHHSQLSIPLPLQRKLDINRIGASDVLSMLFNADLKPRNAISNLRLKFAVALSGVSRGHGIPTDYQHSAKLLKCSAYEIKVLDNMKYVFLRSEEVPFGFVTARLTFQNIDITLVTDTFHLLESANLPPSNFGPRDAWSESRLIAKDPRQTSPNWRVWTWSREGKTYKAWAEFGGTIESPTGVDVLLRDDQSEREIRVPTNLLSDADGAFLKKGRLWEKQSFGDSKLSPWRVLVEDDPKSDSLVFSIPDSSVKSASYQIRYFSPNDKVWIEKLRVARKRAPDSLKTPEAWQSFAGYIR